MIGRKGNNKSVPTAKKNEGNHKGSSSKAKKYQESSTCSSCQASITEHTKALQCDRCEDPTAWKCIDCLDLSVEAYDALMNEANCPLKWFCDKCEKHITTPEDNTEVVRMLQQLLETTSSIEARLNSKADLDTVNDLEKRVKLLEDKVSKPDEPVAPVAHQTDETIEEHVTKAVQEAVNTQREEDRDIQSRKNNVVIYRVPESASKVAEERTQHDSDFFDALCRDALGIDTRTANVGKMFRLGKRVEQIVKDKPRPLLVKLKTEDQKREVMVSLKKLKDAPDIFKRLSVSHDYSPKQRKSIKQALAEAKRKADEDADDQGQPLNYRLRVVGQSSRIKVIQVNTQ